MSETKASSSDQEAIADVHWAPRVNPHLIRRLYETDARGILDEELIDKVGYALYARCRSILRVTEAHGGRVTCPRCGTLIVRASRGWKPADVVACPQYSWRVLWRDYFRTYQDKHLHGGAATPFFASFIQELDRAETPRAKLLAIDRLIHRFHGELARQPIRSAARNLIYARNPEELLAFLDALAYGEGSTPGVRERKQAWDDNRDRSARYRGAGAELPKRAEPPGDRAVNTARAAPRSPGRDTPG